MYRRCVHDPTRIPRLISALQDAWEGQPDLTLPAFLGMLQARGISWASSEEELLALLAQISSEHPSLIDGTLNHPIQITTLNPRLAVTLTGGTAVVRSAADPQRPPSAWRYSGLRPAGPGRPLVVTDAEGVEHRLGVVELATRLDSDAAPAIEGLHSGDVGSAQWLILFEDGRRAILSHRLRIWTTVGRETEVDTLAWVSVDKLEPGAEMQITPAGGGKPLRLGSVREVLLLEL